MTTDCVVTASMNLAFSGWPLTTALERIERVIERIQALPGVAAAGVGTSLPPQASRLRLTLRKGGDSVDYQASGVAVTPGYFQALGMRLLSGRLFTADDDRSRPPVMIMSADTARRFFGDGDPIGQTMTLPATGNGVNASEVMTLVGVVANVKYSGLDAAADDAVYRPFRQQTWVAPYLVAQTLGEPTHWWRRCVAKSPPSIAASSSVTSRRSIRSSRTRPRSHDSAPSCSARWRDSRRSWR